MKPVTAETVRNEIIRLEGFTACTTRPLSMTEEFHLNCLRDLLRVLEAKTFGYVAVNEKGFGTIIHTTDEKDAVSYVDPSMDFIELVVRP